MELKQTKIVEVSLPNGTIINLRAENLGGEEYIAEKLPQSFEEIGATIEEIGKVIFSTLQQIKPHRGSVEFGVKIAVKSGKLTTLLVEGSGEATLNVRLEWEEKLTLPNP
jgi:hypothetical protein